MTRRLLVIQLADIGDLVLSTPALSALRDAHPDAHIAVLTTRHAAPILDGTGLANEVITFDKHAFDRVSALLRPSNAIAALALAWRLRRGRYDTAIVLHHFSTGLGALKFRALLRASGARVRVGLDNGRAGFLTDTVPDRGFGARHQAQYWLDLVGLVGGDTSPRPARIAESAFTLPPKTRLRVAIHAGSGGYSTARRWEPERFAAVADDLHDSHGAEIVLVGGRGDDSRSVLEAMRVRALDLTGQTTLAELAAALRTCDLFIGADSGVMHIAAAVGVPTVAIFGPSNADAWRPWSPTPQTRAIVVRSGVRCSPCAYVGTGMGARDGCPARTCMRLITPNSVIAAAEGVLPSSAPVPVNVPFVTAIERPVETIRILDMPVSVVTFTNWIALIDAWMRGDHPRHVCTINPEMIMIARRDPVFRVVLERADLTVPDGIGLLLAARWQGRPLPERVTGSDGVPLIASEAARRGWRLFFLGAALGVARAAADVLIRAHPGLQIVGVYGGSPHPDEEDAIVARVADSGADILLVAYGAPEQDKWIARNLHRLNVKVAIGVGGTFDFIAGSVPRAPLAWRRLGVEWLYRLVLQPWRIRRMMRLPRFAWLAWWDARRQRRKRDTDA